MFAIWKSPICIVAKHDVVKEVQAQPQRVSGNTWIPASARHSLLGSSRCSAGVLATGCCKVQACNVSRRPLTCVRLTRCNLAANQATKALEASWDVKMLYDGETSHSVC